MRVLGLVTARGGSKSLPRKNVVEVAGRPLLAYTADAALASRRLSRVVVSTDDDEVASVAASCGLEVPFRRPAELAADDTPSRPVVQHAVRWLDEQDGWSADVVVVLQPTSPLRTASDIDDTVDALDRSGADSAVTVVAVPHRYSPFSVMRLDDGRLRDLWEAPLPFDRYRRQAHPDLYARNGPAVLALTVDTLFGSPTLYGSTVVPVVMPESRSIDVDTAFDLQLVELLLTHAKGAP